MRKDMIMANSSRQYSREKIKSIDNRKTRLPSPLVTILVVWSIPLVIIGLGIIRYENINFESWGTLYLIGGVILFTFGFILSPRVSVVPSQRGSYIESMQNRFMEDVRRYGRLIDYLAACGLIAGILFTIEMIFIVGIDPTDFSATREAFTFRQTTLFSQLASVLAAGGYISLVSVIVCWDYLPRGKKFFWLISPLSITVFSLFSAGRQTLFQLILIAFFSFLIYRIIRKAPRRSLGTAIFFGGVIVATIGYFMIVSSQRSGYEVEGMKRELLYRGFLVHLDYPIENRIDNLVPVLKDGIAELVIYLTHPIPNFLIFYELPRPGPYWGLWELPFLARRAESVGLVSSSVRERIDNVYDLFSNSGRSPQVWQTTFRDLIIDFGDIGALFVTVILGYIAGWVFYMNQTRGGLVWAYLLVGVHLICVYSVIISAISDTLIFFYLVIAMVLYFYYESPGKTRHPSRVIPVLKQ